MRGRSIEHDSRKRTCEEVRRWVHSARERSRANRLSMNNSAAVAQESAFEIRFGQVGLAQMRIRSTDADALRVQLAKRVAAAPALFERAALCLDLSPLDHDVSAAELRPMLDAIRRCGVLPVGLAHGTSAIEALARELDLPVLTQFRAQQSYGAAVASVKAVAQPPAPAAPVAARCARCTRRGADRRDRRHSGAHASPSCALRPADLRASSRSGRDERGRRRRGSHGRRLRARVRLAARPGDGRSARRGERARVLPGIPCRAGVRSPACSVFSRPSRRSWPGKPVQAWLDGDDLHFGGSAMTEATSETDLVST